MMIFTDDELNSLRQVIEDQANLDDELRRRCGHLLHLGAFDEAVRSAFVLLEEKLRELIGDETLTGTQLANVAFNPKDGPLSKHLGRTKSEREGLRELYSGAFKLFRNPTAHGAVGYEAADGKEIVGLVNLFLRMIRRAEELPPPDLFPENVEFALRKIEQSIGPGSTSRLRMFLGKCIKTGIHPSVAAKEWIPFRKRALVKYDNWDEPKSHNIAVFYVTVHASGYTIQFPTNYYYSKVIDFNVDRLIDELIELGFYLHGKNQEPRADLRIHNSEEFFDNLAALVTRTVSELEETLSP
jgi:uncharacterized protein (TIGR02391 family)